MSQGGEWKACVERYGYGLLAGLLCLTVSACANVDTLRLTTQTFPPKDSIGEVEVLEHEPSRPHIDVAELSMVDTSRAFDGMQKRILKKAASLGADAVVFHDRSSHVEHQVAYQPVYSPWGLYGPYYGPGAWGGGGWGYGGLYGAGPWGGGGGYGGSIPVQYDVTVRTLKGLAIRYTDSDGTQ